MSDTASPASGPGRPRSLFDKLWESHLVRQESAQTPGILYVDLHLLHEVTSPQAFDELRRRDLGVRRPDRTVATADHSTPTRRREGTWAFASDRARDQVEALYDNCREFGIRLHPLGDDHQGIVHVIGPELGLTRPGMTVVCGDSHTSTHGALGALAFGIGTSEVGHVLATQCLLQRRPRSMRIRVDGNLRPGVGAKDLILEVIRRIGIGGATGHVIEYAGGAVQTLSMEARMTVCNMSIEAGGRAGMVAPDDTTFEYVSGRPEAPREAEWDRALERWRALPGDPGAEFDREVHVDADGLGPMITWGTHPGTAIPVDAPVPEPADDADRRALEYMGVAPGRPLLGHPVDVVFLGSCTNSRLTDLRDAAGMLAGRRVADGTRMLVVPGSSQVKRQAEAEGLDDVFRSAGAEWREAGCSLCIAMNGDTLRPGETCLSTSNRNFEGRQGHGGRTLLASPVTAAASAVAGAVADPRRTGP